MSKRDDLLLQVAKLSFVDRLNNHQIAEILKGKTVPKKTNLTWVADLIDEAGEWLLKRHYELANIEGHTTLEQMTAGLLCSQLGLLHAVIVRELGEYSGYVTLSKRYAAAAAQYFDALCEQYTDQKKQLHVAVCGGQGILDMMTALTERPRHNVHYYPAALLGRTTERCITHIGPETNATIAWARSGKDPNNLFYGTVPPYDFREEHFPTKEQKHEWAKRHVIERSLQLAQQDGIGTIIEHMNENINAAIVGLGLPAGEGPYGRGDFISGILKPLGIDPLLLASEGAIGDIAYNVIDKDGKSDWSWNFFLTLGFGSEHAGADFYRNLVAQGKPVMVMAGINKEPVLRAAINGKLVNVLITDVETAMKLVS
jgi:DNA-binding transcriptional regulator LsrR (DeoR family)